MSIGEGAHISIFDLASMLAGVSGLDRSRDSGRAHRLGKAHLPDLDLVPSLFNFRAASREPHVSERTAEKVCNFLNFPACLQVSVDLIRAVT